MSRHASGRAVLLNICKLFQYMAITFCNQINSWLFAYIYSLYIHKTNTYFYFIKKNFKKLKSKMKVNKTIELKLNENTFITSFFSLLNVSFNSMFK